MIQQVELIISAAERELQSASKCLSAASRSCAGGGARSTSPDPMNPHSHNFLQAASIGSSSAAVHSITPAAALSDEKRESAVAFTGKAIGLLRQAINTFADDVKNWRDDNRLLRGTSNGSSVMSSTTTTTAAVASSGSKVTSSSVLFGRNNSSGGAGGGGARYSLSPDTAALEQRQIMEALLEEQRIFLQATHLGQAVAYERAARKADAISKAAESLHLWRCFAREKRRRCEGGEHDDEEESNTRGEQDNNSRRRHSSSSRRRKSTSPQQQQEHEHENDDGEDGTSSAASSTVGAREETLVKLVQRQSNQLAAHRAFHKWTLSFYRRQYDYCSGNLQRRSTALSAVVNFASVLREQFVVRKTVGHYFSQWCNWASLRRGRVRRYSEQLVDQHAALRRALLDSSQAHFSDLWRLARSSHEKAEVLFTTVREQSGLLTQQSQQLAAQQRQLLEISASSSSAAAGGGDTPPPPLLTTTPTRGREDIRSRSNSSRSPPPASAASAAAPAADVSSSSSQQIHYYHQQQQNSQYQVHQHQPQQQQQLIQHNFEIQTSAFDGGWQGERLNALACETLFEAHSAVSDLLLQCSAVMCSCHFALFRSNNNAGGSFEDSAASSIPSPLLMSFATSAEKKARERSNQRAAAAAAAAAGNKNATADGGDDDENKLSTEEELKKLQDAYATLLRRNYSLRSDMRSLESVNAGLLSELTSSNQERTLLRKRAVELERALHEAQITEARLRDRCVQAFLLCSSSVAAFIDASEVKSQLWLAQLEELQLERLLETERQMEELQISVQIQQREQQQDERDPHGEDASRRGDQSMSRPPLSELSQQLVSDFSLGNPRHVWQLARALRRRTNPKQPQQQQQSRQSSSSRQSSPSALLNENDDDDDETNTPNRSASAGSQQRQQQQERDENGGVETCRTDAVSMLLSAATAFSKWKDAVLQRRRRQKEQADQDRAAAQEERDEMEESADVANARLQTLTQKHGEAMAQLRSMEQSVKTLQRDAKLYQSVVDRMTADGSGSGTGDGHSSLGLMAPPHANATQSERENAARARCFRRWSTWVAARLRQRVYDATAQQNAQVTAAALDSKAQAWAYEVAASAGHQMTPLRVAVGEDYVSAGSPQSFFSQQRQQQQQQSSSSVSATGRFSALNVELSPEGSPSRYI